MRKCFYNANIHTINKKNEIWQAIITNNQKIEFVGSNDDALSFCDAQTQKIDLDGKLVLPGFIDDHTHFIQGGLSILGIQLRNCKSKEEFVSNIKDFASKNSGQWITGGDWNHQEWKEPVLPSKKWIDEFTPDNPVLINRLDGHLALANSKALKSANITKNTPSPIGGLIEKDENGEPTGILKDNAMLLVQNLIPKPEKSLLEKAMVSALNEAKQCGVTSIQDISSYQDYLLFDDFNKNQKLSCRIYSRLPIIDFRKYYEDGIKIGSGNDFLKSGSLKAFADGSLGSQTAWFFEPYLNSSFCGLPMDIIDNGSLRKWALEADNLGFNLSIHAIGDNAVFEVLDIFDEVKRKNPPWDRRFRIEHAQHINKELLNKIKELDVIISAQPYHLYDDGSWAENFIGKARSRYTYAFNSFLENEIKLCFGSDWTVAPMSAIAGIYAASGRKTSNGKNENGWFSEEKISVQQAVECYTRNNAYAEYSENLKGTIEKGKYADFIVLSDDIFKVDLKEIPNTKILMTIFNGEVIFAK